MNSHFLGDAMHMIIRLVLAAGVLLLASLSGCLLSAQQPHISLDVRAASVGFAPLAMIVGGIALSTVSLGIYAFRLRRQYLRSALEGRVLEQKNRQLQDFSSIAAHDLTAPLRQQAALMACILEDVAEAKITLPREAQHHFATLEDLSHRMSDLVHDLLTYAKADSDQGKAMCFMPASRLDSVLRLSGVTTSARITVMPDMPAVQVPPDVFDMVMRNLVTNAIKHHDKQLCNLEIRAFQQGNTVRIEVEDDGPGVPDAAHVHVFEPFCRLTNTSGSGLGLALVKRAVTGWGGSILVRNAVGRGAVFEITLPSPA